jgi:Reverse transcriptase (RNA-dependent DNA polymerase)
VTVRWEDARLDVAGAADRVAKDMGQDWVKDPIYRSDVLEALRTDEELVMRRLVSEDPPRRGLRVPVPKSAIAVRPAVDLRTLDRVAYQALVDTFAFQILADLPEFVSGWRYNDDPTGPADLADQSAEWRTYQAQVNAALGQEPKWVLTTDIAAFFQSIPHDLLRERLDASHPRVRNAIFDYLGVWHPRRVGVPQRVLASSLLANAYLEPIDAILDDYESLRWMDDIVVFCESRRAGIEAILRLQEALHPLGLQINEAKTSLLPFEEGRQRVVDVRLGDIEYGLGTGVPGADPFDRSQRELYEVWDEVMTTPEAADRTRFSFCVTRFIELDDTEPATRILGVLDRLPHVSDHTSRYLRSALEDVDVLDRVLKYLRSRRNQWEWQEYRLATLFWHSERLSREQLEFIRRRAASGNTYWAARNVYFRVLGRHGTVADARELERRAEAEGDLEIVRGQVIGAVESGRLPDRRVREMGRDDADLQRLITYLRGRNMTVPPLSF